jgi:SAM-dependent MidA family methyltransferase
MANAAPPLSADDADRSERVVERLRVAADASGFLPFDRFMEIALYEPAIGFYDQPRSPLGPDGDFYTAAHITPVFASTVAARIRAIRSGLRFAGPFLIVELGPGDGTLAAGIVTALGDDAPGMEYVLVDRSSSRGREAEERVVGTRRQIHVRRSESVGSLGPFFGVVLANEFLDAQPARRLRWDGAEWQEMGVRVRVGGVDAAEGPPAGPTPGLALPSPAEPGLIVEFSSVAEGTIREIGDHLIGGEAILLDYGLEEPELVHAHARGTLAAVRQHRFLADPLVGAGTADLSVFVNFSRIRAAARASGLAEVSFRSQAEALGAWGFPGILNSALHSSESSEAKVRLQLAAKNLLFGFERFRVLELAPAARGKVGTGPT